MTIFDLTRMAMYVLIAPGLVAVGLAIYRVGMRLPAFTCFALALFFAWLLFEATLTASGINTRPLRAWATPITVAIALGVVATVFRLWRRYGGNHPSR